MTKYNPQVCRICSSGKMAFILRQATLLEQLKVSLDIRQYLTLEPSHSGNEDDDASGYVLFFLDLNESAVIVNPGHGVEDFSADVLDIVRISGKGYRPEQRYPVRTVDAFGNTSYENVVSSSVEQWYRNQNDETLRYKLSERNPETLKHLLVLQQLESFYLEEEVLLIGIRILLMENPEMSLRNLIRHYPMWWLKILAMDIQFQCKFS